MRAEDLKNTFDFAATQLLLKRVRDELVEAHFTFKKDDELKTGVAKQDNGDLVVVGWASTGDVDRMDDIIDPTAFQRTLERQLADGVVLAHHSPTWPVGLPDDISIKKKGVQLRSVVKAGFDPTTPEGRAYTGVALGLIRAYSVGFRILPGGSEEVANEKAAYKIERVKRRITDLDWYETSVVAIPANPKTMFSLSKAVELGTDWPEKMYAEHRIRAAVALFGMNNSNEEHEMNHIRLTRAAQALLSSDAAGRFTEPGVLVGRDGVRDGG